MDAYNKERLANSLEWRSQPELYETVLAILVKHDPQSICSPHNPKAKTEYSYEVDTILPRLSGARSADDVAQIVREEFSRWFDGDIGKPESYPAIGIEIWLHLQAIKPRIRSASKDDSTN